MVKIGEVMSEVNNYFEKNYINGNVVISSGVIVGLSVPTGTYIAITGSLYNDGVYSTNSGLTDESFHGRIWILHPPQSFVDLVAVISAYDDSNPSGSMVSETFGDYSYNRGSGDSSTGTASGWAKVYRDKLRPYRRMYTEVDVC